jgi:hypothetical protein
MGDLANTGTYEGEVINKKTAPLVQELSDQINHWGNLDPTIFHTPLGLDKLKQSIYDIGSSASPGSPAQKASSTVYNAIKDQINQQAPTYSKVMKDYSDASDQLNELQNGFSLNGKTDDAALRKLQSIMRNNVNTNYGNRLDSMTNLESQTGANILPQLAGQAMNSWTPRGLMGAGEMGATIMGGIMHPALLPGLMAAAPFASPRLVGEGSYGLGRMVGAPMNAAKSLLSPIGQLAQQYGLLDQSGNMQGVAAKIPSLMYAQ